MLDRLLSAVLMTIFVCFLPLFISIVMNSDNSNGEGQDQVVVVDVKDVKDTKDTKDTIEMKAIYENSTYNNYRFTKDEFLDVVGADGDGRGKKIVTNVVMDEDGYVESLTILNTIVTGEWLKEKLFLSSEKFTVYEEGDLILISALSNNE